MAQVCCSKGHIYDTEIYGNSCPYCDNGAGHTIDFGTANDQMAGLGKSIAYSTVMPDEIKKTSAPASYVQEQEQLKKTVGVFVKKTGLDPIVGWLVCVEGHDKGCDYRLCAKTNTIGRGEDMDVRIKGDDTISSNIHAKIDYDMLNNAFYLLPANNKNTIYVNNAPLYAAQRLNPYDRLRFGQSDLVFVPFCCDMFTWPTEGER